MSAFNKKSAWIILGVILVLGLATVAYAFTSFTPDLIFGESPPDNGGHPPCVGVTMPEGNGYSGWDIDEVGLRYDRATDTLYVGISMWNDVIAGDVENDGNPGGAHTCLSSGGGSDWPDLGGPTLAGEAIDFIIDKDGDGDFDYIAGVSHSVDISGFAVAYYTGAQPPISYPGDGYGSAAGTGIVTNNPAPGNPDFEFTINNFSSLLGRTPDDIWTFRFMARAGSMVDAGTGEDIMYQTVISTPTPTPTSTPTATATPKPEVYRIYLPCIFRLLCGWNDPDDDEPYNDIWASPHVPYGYGLFTGRTFWSLTKAAGQEGDDPDWFKWKVEWTGTHWLWTEDLDPSSLRIQIFLYRATGDPVNPLELVAWGEPYASGEFEVWLEEGQTYYVLASNLTAPAVGCYSIWLDP